MSIFQALSNLKHNGSLIAMGEFFEGEIKEFEQLVNESVLRHFPKAKTVEDAKAVVDSEAAKAAEASEEEAVEPQNTWGPQPDPIEEEKNAPEDAGAIVIGEGDQAPVGGNAMPVKPAETGDNL